MTISAVTFRRLADTTRVFATSDLVDPFFHWYLDGAWVGATTVGHRDFRLERGEQVRVDVLDTTDPAFDPVANAPEGHPARRSLWWVRSPDADVALYTVEQKQGAGAYAVVARVPQHDDAWALGWLSGRLEDLAAYTWRVTPYDAAGNAGTPWVFGPETIVRRPDAPDFALSFDDGTDRVTVEAAP